MKKTFTITLMAVCICAAAQEKTRNITADIRAVTVFLEGAQVNRKTSVNLEAGVTTLSLSGIAPGIREQSIQVSITAPAKIMSVSFNVNYLDELQKPEKVRLLEEEQKRLKRLIDHETALQAVYHEEQEILKTNKSIGGTQEGVQITELRTAMNYFRERLLEINDNLEESRRREEGLRENLARAEAQLKELNAVKPQPSGEIVVKVTSPVKMSADMQVQYLVDNARWYPSYDIRAVDVKSPISVTYKANISQQSGEDWRNVTLTVSSANPFIVGARPVVTPWILGFNNTVSVQLRGAVSGVSAIYGSRAPEVVGRVRDSNGMGIPGANVVVKGTSMGTTTDADGNFSIALPAHAQELVVSFVGYTTQEVSLAGQRYVDIQLNEDVNSLQEVVVVGYGLSSARSGYSSSYVAREKKVLMATPVVRQTDVEFTVREQVTIRSDGEVRTTEMVAYDLDAEFEYYCAPKLSKEAFLTARITEWDEFNFLDGEASVFFEGKYIGKSLIDSRNTKDTLMLSLGRDAGIVIERQKIRDLSSKQFLGSNSKVVMAYEISVRNKKAEDITLVIEDQLPIPNTRSINVDILELSNGEHNEETGLVKWKQRISAGSNYAVKFAFAVRYPKYSTILLE